MHLKAVLMDDLATRPTANHILQAIADSEEAADEAYSLGLQLDTGSSPESS